jgi:starvation-inducible DNA-binding protein
LKSNTKSVVIEILNARLAEAIDLSLIAKQAHWNVKGPHFIAIHEMLDGFRKDLDEHVDTIAERAVQLGGTALGTTQAVAAASKLPAYPTDIYSTKDHLSALIERYAATAKSARAAIDEADEAGDADAADILTAYSRAIDKSLWFLEAHIQEKE